MRGLLNAEAAAEELLYVIQTQNRERLDLIHKYRIRDFPDPYWPEGMSGEHRDLMGRAKQPWATIPGKAVAMAMAVEGYRTPDDKGSNLLTDSEAWRIWQRSNMDFRQAIAHQALADYGQAFILSEVSSAGKPVLRILPTRSTAMLFDDIVSDDNAQWALTITRKVRTLRGKDLEGEGILWDRHNRYPVLFDKGGDMVVGEPVAHGGRGHNPVTRLVVELDDEGRTDGELEPVIPWQDMFNQVLANLLSTQTDSAFRTIWGSGIRTEYATDANGSVLTDRHGSPVRKRVQVKPATIITAEDSQAKFGVLPGSDQHGYIATLKMMIQQFSAFTQTPPNFLLGSMDNVGVEAIDATEKAFLRKVGRYQRGAGEGWERGLRICQLMVGKVDDEDERLEHGEVVWTDFDKSKLSGIATALGTLAEKLGVPKRGLWDMVPGVSSGQLDEWKRLADQDDELARLAAFTDVSWADDTDNPADVVEGAVG